MVGKNLGTGSGLFLGDPLTVGPVVLRNRVVLAPMSGITDAPFRRLAERLGAGLVVSEMTACAGLARGDARRAFRSERSAARYPRDAACRLRAHWMAEGARIAEARAPTSSISIWAALQSR